jgi:uncharacterized membrane protein YhfC
MDASFLFHLLNSLLMMAIPITLAILLTRKWKLSWRFWLVGAATFILSQVGHIPFNSLMTLLLNKTPLANLSPQGAAIFNAVFLGLSAGLFEELFRYGMFRWWLKDARSWRKAVLAGAGHGGGEAVILGGLALFAFLQMAVLRNMDLATQFSGETLATVQQQVAAYWSMPWYDSLLGAVERLFTVVVQISFAVIVAQAFLRRKNIWIWLAVGYHALVDASSVWLMSKVSIYWVEGVVGVFALISLVIIFSLRTPEPQPASVSEPLPASGNLPGPSGDDPSLDQLENSKYQ